MQRDDVNSAPTFISFHLQVAEINERSAELVHKHATAFPTKRVLAQRHDLRAVPVTQVNGEWQDEQHIQFWIYGFEREVYYPDYPNQCCWNCSIL